MAPYRSKKQVKAISLKENVNFLFFIGKGKAHSFRLPFGLILGAGLGLGAVSIWAIASLVIVLFMDHQNNWLEGQLEATRSIVLKYQAKYEGLYEESYPASVGRDKSAAKALEVVEKQLPDSRNNEPAVAAAPKAKEISTATPVNEPKNTQPKQLAALGIPGNTSQVLKTPEAAEKTAPAANEATTAAKKSSQLAKMPTKPRAGRPVAEMAAAIASAAAAPVDNAVTAAAAAEADAPLSSTLLGIIDVKLTHDATSVALAFGIKNKGRMPKVSGLVYAIGEWQNEDNPPRYIGVPSKIAMNPEIGLPANPLAGESFSARRYRPTNFKFQKPANEAGQFTNIRIVVLDKKGNMILQHNEKLPISQVAKKSKNP